MIENGNSQADSIRFKRVPTRKSILFYGGGPLLYYRIYSALYDNILHYIPMILLYVLLLLISLSLSSSVVILI